MEKYVKRGLILLEKEETLALIAKAQGGDREAAGIILQENAPLVKSVIKRYKNKGVEYDDLFQLGSIGLLKAVKNFSADFDVCFSTYAVPMIIGEIKRYLRDDGYVKVSRSTRALSYKIAYYIDEYKSKFNDSPTIDRIAKHFNIDSQEVVFAMDATLIPVSIYDKGDDEKGLSIGERIANKFSVDDEVDKLSIKEAISKLDEREKKIVILRFFRDKTQSEVARELNVSQVQVSRLENKIINKIKEDIV